MLKRLELLLLYIIITDRLNFSKICPFFVSNLINIFVAAITKLTVFCVQTVVSFFVIKTNACFFRLTAEEALSFRVYLMIGNDMRSR